MTSSDKRGTTNTFLEKKAKELHLKNFRGVVFRNNFKDMVPLRSPRGCAGWKSDSLVALEQECGIYGSKSDSENMHHWCAWYKDARDQTEGGLYCFDSFGLPPTKEVIEYLKQGDDSKKILYSTFQIQKFDESTCGEYCLYFLDKMNTSGSASSTGKNYVDVILSLVNNSTF